MAYNRIKKTDVFNYFIEKLNSTSFSSAVKFDIESYYNILYKPITDDDGKLATAYETNEETYREITTNKVPVAVSVSTGDFKSVKSIDESEFIDTADFSVVLSFFVFMDNTDVHYLQMLALEQFRDILIANLDFIKVKRVNYLDLTEESYDYETIATNAEDVQIGNITTINGYRFLDCSIQIDISTSKDVIYGNQFQFYAKSKQEKTFKWEQVPLLVAPFDYEDTSVYNLPTPLVENKKAVIEVTNVGLSWEEQKTPLEAPFDYDVADVSLLPQPPSTTDLKARVVRYIWDKEETSHVANIGYIQARLEDLEAPDEANIKAVATGFNLSMTTLSEWNAGYALQWVSKVSLLSPYDYDLEYNQSLPTLLALGLKARRRTNTWQTTSGLADYGFIGTSLSFSVLNANIGKIATVVGYNMVSATEAEYTASSLKIDITVYGAMPVRNNDIWFAFQSQELTYFNGLNFMYTNGGVLRIFDNETSTYLYRKFTLGTGSANQDYILNTTLTEYWQVENVQIADRITITVPVGSNFSDVWFQLQDQEPTIFANLQDFYDNNGIIRTNNGIGHDYYKLVLVNSGGNIYYTSISSYAYYLSVNDPFITYEYYLSVFDKYVENSLVPYQRILPLMVEWGSVQSTTGGQLLHNPQMSEELKRKAQLIHSIVASRGWAITMTFVLDDKDIIEEFFKESYPFKDDMQKTYYIKMDYLKKYTTILSQPYFQVYEPMGFEIKVIPTEPNVLSLNYGDVVTFVISFVPSWE